MTTQLDETFEAFASDGVSTPALLQPGKAYLFVIDRSGGHEHGVQGGHRIRVEISGSNFPRFDRIRTAESSR